MTPVALSIAGSDPSGGAGIQADLKTFHRFRVYGEAVVTMVTVQNTRGVRRIHVLDHQLIAEQINAVVTDIPPKAGKTGALGSRGVVEAVARAAAAFDFPLVIDPVMLSKNGAAMLDEDARRAFIDQLLPRAFLLMPNLPEAAALVGFPVETVGDMKGAAEKLRSMGAKNVLVKGGHLEGDALDVLLTSGDELHEFCAARVASVHTHGTGCTYSAAITAELAKGAELSTAVHRAKAFITDAIRSSPGLGGGSGPLNHFAE